MSPVVLIFFQLFVVLALAPFTTGLVRVFKARLQGRYGASPLLPYWSYATLLKKENIISANASWVYRITPYAVLGSAWFLAAVLPLIAIVSVPGFSNFILVAGVVMLGSVFLVLGGLDGGSAFGGMGSSREMTIAALLEPAIVITFASFAILAGSSDISDMVSGELTLVSAPYLALSLVALMFIALAENARYPVDNPATHLELTMVHEAMVLGYSGPYLAMLEYASSLKLTIFALLVANFVFPWPVHLTQDGELLTLLLSVLVAILKVTVLAFALALLESTIAKMRFYRVQEFLTGAFFLALAGLSLSLISLVI